MANYIHYDYNQNLMLAINLQDQLQVGTFEHALHYLVTEKRGLSIFDKAFKMTLKVVPLTIQPFC